jgi:hypothetical protein
MHPARVPLLLAADVERLGAHRRSLARGADRGDLVRIHRGVYVEAEHWNDAQDTGRHLLRMRAVTASTSERVPFSHWSAAVAHELPVSTRQLGRVHRTRLAAHAELPGVSTHALTLDARDVVERHGLPVTSIARTVIDVAASARFPDAVALADAGLRVLADEAADGRPALLEAWERAQPRRAARRVERVLAFADGRAESVGESLSRVTIAELGLPMPVLQHRFFDRDGFVGKVDFWWPTLGVVGEFDGRVKYFDPGLTRGDPAAVVFEEKVREDRLRALVPHVVRWGWPEAVSAERLGPRLAAVGLRS